MVKTSPRVVFDDVRIPMRDGTRLAADVVRLDDGLRRPVLLARSPYLRAATRQGIDVAGLARAGWVLVVQDTRGRGESEGSADPFVHEGADGAATVAWCARQAWSDGRVAMTGGSYLSFAQLQAAAWPAPALRAISLMATPDGASDNWHEGGAFSTGLVTHWHLMMALTDPAVGARARRRLAALAADPLELMRTPHARNPLRELYPPYERALRPSHRPFSDTVRRRYHKTNVAAHHVAGWYDLFCESSIRSWQGMRREASSEYARCSQRLVIGPWVHSGMLVRTTAETDFGAAADGLANGTMAAVYQWLRNAVDGQPVERGVRAFVLGRNAWVELDGWPPPSRPLELHLSSSTSARSIRGDGTLLAKPGPAGIDRFLHDPGAPVPTRGGRILGPWLPTAGPIDQRLLEERDDVLVFSSAPLRADLTVMGAVTADIVFATSGRSADLAVKLVDVQPDGRAFNVLDSVHRAAFTSGRPKPVRVELGSIAQCFLRGHSIRVEVASSNFPRFDINPSTGAALGSVDRYEPAVQTVYHGGGTGSRITLPVV